MCREMLFQQAAKLKPDREPPHCTPGTALHENVAATEAVCNAGVTAVSGARDAASGMLRAQLKCQGRAGAASGIATAAHSRCSTGQSKVTHLSKHQFSSGASRYRAPDQPRIMLVIRVRGQAPDLQDEGQALQYSPACPVQKPEHPQPQTGACTRPSGAYYCDQRLPSAANASTTHRQR